MCRKDGYIFGGVSEAFGKGRKDEGPTLARQEERLPASWRARSRRRSYSASVVVDWGWWLNATRGGKVIG